MGFLINPFAFISSIDWSTWNGSLDGSDTGLGGGVLGNNKVVIRKLDTDKLIAVWANSTDLRAVVITLSDITATIGTPITVVSFGSSIVLHLGLTVLDTGRAVISYGDSSAGQINARVLSVSGTTVTANASTTVAASIATDGCLLLQDTDKVMLVFKRSNVGKAVIFTTTGTTVNAPGTEVTFEAASIGGVIAADVLSTTASIVAYQVSSNTSKALILTVSGTTVTANTKYTLDTTSANDINGVTALGSSGALISTTASGGSGPGFAVAVTISGTVITVGSRTTYQTGLVYTSATGTGSSSLNSTQVMVTYERDSDGKPYGVVGTVSGTTVTFGTPVTLSSTSINGTSTSVCTVSSGRACSMYMQSASPYVKVMKQV